MAGVLWMLFVICPFVLSESGDDYLPDGEIVTCSSSLTLRQTDLTCTLNNEHIEEVKRATLCKMRDKRQCTNATLGPQYFTFQNLVKLLEYELSVNMGEENIKKSINLTQLVKIPVPEIKNAAYREDTEEGVISIEHKHDFVKNPKFEVEILGGKLANKCFTTENRDFAISRDRLGGDGDYSIRVRAKPMGFFDGDWSEWSLRANFTIKTAAGNLGPPNVTYIIITISVILVFIIALGALRWRTEIKGYITPNIPHPKATLAQMHSAREGLPFAFSPEIFGDVFIHCVDYADEKPSTAEDEHRYSQEISASSRPASVCEINTKADEWLPRELSHLKIRLLDELDFSKEIESGGSQAVMAPQRECKDEAYVTMSSLFKTQ
ncbi:interleukin-7 receptor subunit alpha-like [Myxocyprinus asiaticus]|uniref:interleukin-7 receptor subunit alpha-like n=1 Tax=Myxocyprinus asiaticus TaxID=70543 RepID=UPI002222CC9E|nr:interleukin-7 receptor subunit alpha-like [Myxocyprinus asiaticus]